jgi:hypothetical protein
MEDEFDWLGRASYARRPDDQRGLRNYGSGRRNGFASAWPPAPQAALALARTAAQGIAHRHGIGDQRSGVGGFELLAGLGP